MSSTRKFNKIQVQTLLSRIRLNSSWNLSRKRRINRHFFECKFSTSIKKIRRLSNKWNWKWRRSWSTAKIACSSSKSFESVTMIAMVPMSFTLARNSSSLNFLTHLKRKLTHYRKTMPSLKSRWKRFNRKRGLSCGNLYIQCWNMTKKQASSSKRAWCRTRHTWQIKTTSLWMMVKVLQRSLLLLLQWIRKRSEIRANTPSLNICPQLLIFRLPTDAVA